MKHVLMRTWLAMFVLVISVAAWADEPDLSGFLHPEYFITPQKLHSMLGDPKLVLLDGNNPKVYGKGHIPGAVHVGFHFFSKTVGRPGDPGWGTSLPIEELGPKLRELGINDDSIVVLYSDMFKGPGADGRNFWQLRMAGMKNVKLLYGGLPLYSSLGYELTREVTKPSPSDEGILTLHEYDRSWYATMDQVHESLGVELLIDTRTKKEFDGSTNAGEPRGGHIAGAKWMLWLDILNKDGSPRSPEQIKSIMKDRFALTPQDSFTVY